MKVEIVSTEPYTDAHNPAHAEAITEYAEQMSAYNERIATAHAGFIVAEAQAEADDLKARAAIEAKRILHEADPENVEEPPEHKPRPRPTPPDLSKFKAPEPPDVSPTQSGTIITFRLKDGREGRAYVFGDTTPKDAIKRAVDEMPPKIDVEPGQEISI